MNQSALLRSAVTALRAFVLAAMGGGFLLGAAVAQEGRPGSVAPPAEVEGEVITSDALERALAVSLAQIEEQRYTLLCRKIEELIGERVLAREARKRGMSVGHLLKLEVYAMVSDVTDEKLTAFITQNRAGLPPGDEAELRQIVSDHLRSQRVARQRRAYLQALRANASVTTYPVGGKECLSPESYAQGASKVLPKGGYTLPIKWGDLGPRLVQLGVIDLGKLKQLYGKSSNLLPADFRHLEGPSDALISITSENSRFLVTVLWGLGLANKNPVLEKMAGSRGGRQKLMGLASTGGWTLGAKPVPELYDKFEVIRLTPEQKELVSDLAQSIYRPCCDNSTAFPDCNHGMALLGLMELMAANGFDRDEILKAALKFNSFWFPQQYVEAALLFELRGVQWDAVNPAEILGSRYSNLSGWTANVNRELKKLVHIVPPETEAASCGVSE
jgi:hypothetical protein